MKHVLRMGKKELSPTFLSDIMVTAFDGDYGGSLFWADVESYQIQADHWEWVIVADKYEDTEPPRKVTHETLTLGMQRILDMPDGRYEGLKERIQELDAGSLDANDADSIVQFGLFEKEVYA